jgi:hypothetical protein
MNLFLNFEKNGHATEGNGKIEKQSILKFEKNGHTTRGK